MLAAVLPSLALAAELLTLVFTLAGLAFLLMNLLALRSFTQQPAPPLLGSAPTISVLKPVKGSDPDHYGSFASHCRQQYSGRWELLLGASAEAASAETQALERMAAQLREEFPAVPVRVVLCPERLGLNGKVSTLAQMVPHALGEILVVNDADIRVGPRYLEAIARWLQEPGVGLVTAPYFARVVGGGSVWARLESLGIATDLMMGILTARWIERGVRFGLGGTLALRRETLEAVGGFQGLLGHLADDYELGARVHGAGLRAVLMQEVVSTSVPNYSAAQFWQHQVRWARTIRDARPVQYVGVAVTHGLPWAMLTVVSSGLALWSFSLLSVVLLLRVTVALQCGAGILRDEQVLRDIWLLPLRDSIALLLWAWSYASDDVVWRGERFRVVRGLLRRL